MGGHSTSPLMSEIIAYCKAALLAKTGETRQVAHVISKAHPVDTCPPHQPIHETAPEQESQQAALEARVMPASRFRVGVET